MDRQDEVPGIDEALARAWPEGVPEADRSIRARIAPDRVSRLARRLEAVRLWTEAGKEERPRSVVEAAGMAGVGLAQFHSLAAAWRRERTLASLGIHAGERSRKARAEGEEARNALIERIRALLEEQPDLGPAEARRRLADAGSSPGADATLLRLMSDARRLVPPGRFGHRLILDSAGLDFVDHEGLRMRLYGVVDENTGLVLGWADGTDRSWSLGHVWSARDALGRLPSMRLEGLRAHAGDTVVDARLHVDDAHGRELFERTFGRAPPRTKRSAGTLGRALVDVLGERLGDVWLGTGERADGVAYRTGRRIALPEYTAPISWSIDAAVEQHNAARLEAVGGRATIDIDAEAARVRVDAALRRVAALEAELSMRPAQVGEEDVARD